LVTFQNWVALPHRLKIFAPKPEDLLSWKLPQLRLSEGTITSRPQSLTFRLGANKNTFDWLAKRWLVLSETE
jgi:hypothetical protein